MVPLASLRLQPLAEKLHFGRRDRSLSNFLEKCVNDSSQVHRSVMTPTVVPCTTLTCASFTGTRNGLPSGFFEDLLEVRSKVPVTVALHVDVAKPLCGWIECALRVIVWQNRSTCVSIVLRSLYVRRIESTVIVGSITSGNGIH